MVRGSRTLNDNGSVLGLSTSDLIGSVAVMTISSELLRPVHLDILSVPLAVAALTALIPIRLRHRRKIIRDTIGYYLGARLIARKSAQRAVVC